MPHASGKRLLDAGPLITQFDPGVWSMIVHYSPVQTRPRSRLRAHWDRMPFALEFASWNRGHCDTLFNPPGFWTRSPGRRMVYPVNATVSLHLDYGRLLRLLGVDCWSRLRLVRTDLRTDQPNSSEANWGCSCNRISEAIQKFGYFPLFWIAIVNSETLSRQFQIGANRI